MSNKGRKHSTDRPISVLDRTTLSTSVGRPTPLSPTTGLRKAAGPSGRPKSMMTSAHGESVTAADVVVDKMTGEINIAPSDLDNPERVGFLHVNTPALKSGDRRSRITTAFAIEWKTRYCVLKANLLYMFASPKETSAIAVFNLSGYNIIEETKTDAEGSKRVKRWKFHMRHDTELNCELAVDSRDELKQWVEKLSEATLHTPIPSGITDPSVEAVRSTVAKKSTIKSGRRANPVHFSRPKSAIIYALSEDEVKKAYTDKVQSSGVKKDERLGLINLLDKKVLRTTITSKTTCRNLLDNMCKHVGTDEMFYFGLEYQDSKEEWAFMELDDRVMSLKHHSQTPIVINLTVRLVPINLDTVIQFATIHQLYLYSKRQFMSGDLLFPAETAILLASFMLQAELGQYNEVRHTMRRLRDYQLLPDEVVEQYELPPNVNRTNFWTERIIHLFSKHGPLSKPKAQMAYLKIMAEHSQFGIVYFDIQNKRGTPLLLGMHPLYVNVYRPDNKEEPLVNFQWSEVRTMSVDMDKFIIKLKDPKVADFTAYTNRNTSSQRIIAQAMLCHKGYLISKHNPMLVDKTMGSQIKAAAQKAKEERVVVKQAIVEEKKRFDVQIQSDRKEHAVVLAKQIEQERAVQQELAKEQEVLDQEAASRRQKAEDRVKAVRIAQERAEAEAQAAVVAAQEESARAKELAAASERTAIEEAAAAKAMAEELTATRQELEAAEERRLAAEAAAASAAAEAATAAAAVAAAEAEKKRQEQEMAAAEEAEKQRLADEALLLEEEKRLAQERSEEQAARVQELEEKHEAVEEHLQVAALEEQAVERSGSGEGSTGEGSTGGGSTGGGYVPVTRVYHREQESTARRGSDAYKYDVDKLRDQMKVMEKEKKERFKKGSQRWYQQASVSERIKYYEELAHERRPSDWEKDTNLKGDMAHYPKI